MTAEIRPLFGGFTHQPEVVDSVVRALEEMLQLAKDGQLVGLAAAMVDYKGDGSYSLSGRISGYNLLGGLEMAKAKIIGFNFDCEDD